MKKSVLVLSAFLFTLSVTAWCQDTARIVGTVSDTSGAVIPGAKVTISNPDKGFTRDLTTDSAGYYSVSALPTGAYVVSAEAPSFQKLVHSDITLQVGQVQRVDLQLTVGQVTQEVHVTANVVQVQTETAAISGVVSSNQISKLELNGRNWVSLALLVPGAAPMNGLNTTTVGVYGNNSISFNGNRTQYANWEIDGGNNTDEGSAGTFNTYPNLDSIQEFRISTSNYGADMGKHAGANIELVTKSGTKDFHGTLSEYNRNSAAGASNFFLNRNGQKKGFLNQNEYGYTLGGPFFIPGHYNTDKSKTFFFWSQDWRKIRQGQTIGNNVPTAAMRTGDFTECGDTTSQAYADGCRLPKINGVTYKTVAQMQPVILAKYPTLTPADLTQAFTNATDLLNGLVPLGNVPNIPGHWITSSSAPTNWRQEQIRVDQNVGDKTRVFVRYTQDAWNTLTVPALWSGSSYDTIKTPFDGPGKSAVLNIAHTFKPNLMNEFMAAYTTDHIILANLAADSVAMSINRPSGFVMNHLFPANNSNPLLPAISLSGHLNFGATENASNHPWKNSNPIIVWKDNLAWVHGSHTTKMGFYLENYRKSEQFGANTQGFLRFNGGGAVTTGNGLADMFLGLIQSYNEGSQAVNGVPVGGYPKGHWQMTDLEPYIQDDWKVTHKLTLNLGLRYYSYTRIHDVSRPTIDSGFLPNRFNPANEDPLDAKGNVNTTAGLNTYTAPGNGLVICGQNGIPKGCQLNNSSLNFAPRFGFAYDPWGTGKTVIRGAYGIFFESGNGNEAQTEGGEGNPPSEFSPSGFDIVGYSNIVPGAIGPTNYTAVPYSQGWPYVEQYNLSVQHQFGTSDLLEVDYVGNLGRHLARNRLVNQIPVGVTTENVPVLAGFSKPDKSGLGLNPSCDASGNCNVQAILINQFKPGTFFSPFVDYNTLQQKQNTAVSTYNALQVSYNHRFSSGLTLQAAYTWSHTIDDSSSTYQQGPGAVDGNYDLSRWKATSDLNRAQILTVNYIYELPFFKNTTNRFVKQALGGWQISGITSFFSGTPVDFNCGVSGFSSGIGRSVRCNPVAPLKIHKVFGSSGACSGQVKNQSVPGCQYPFGPTLQWFDPSTYTQPLASQLLANGQPGMFGYMGRNPLTGPGRNNTDLAVIKDFETPWLRGEHSTVEFRGEAFNAFNHTQYKGISTGCSGNTPFGVNCYDGPSGNASRGFVNSVWDPRVVQFGLKFIF